MIFFVTAHMPDTHVPKIGHLLKKLYIIAQQETLDSFLFPPWESVIGQEDVPAIYSPFANW